MELSPLARARLERIGTLSQTEQQELVDEREVERVLSPFFAGTSTADELWQQMKALAESHGPAVIRRAQLKLLDAMRLQMSEADYARSASTLLALETLKGSSSYSTIEMLLGSVEALRQRYAEVKQQAYEQLRQQVDQQVRAQSEQARRQGLLMNTEASVEASIKATPEWKDFMSRQDAAAEQSLHDYIARIRSSL
jgi:hypothetical protein